MAENYRVAIIGSTGRGDYGHGLDVAWKEIPQAEVVALADDNEKGRGAAVEKTGAKTAYADYRMMLDKEKPAIVSICQRWIDRHHEMIMACVGAHPVLHGKALRRTLTEADQTSAPARCARQTGNRPSDALCPSFPWSRSTKTSWDDPKIRARQRPAADRKTCGCWGATC